MHFSTWTKNKFLKKGGEEEKKKKKKLAVPRVDSSTLTHTHSINPDLIQEGDSFTLQQQQQLSTWYEHVSIAVHMQFTLVRSIIPPC